MVIIGLTGMSGAGKSTLSRIFSGQDFYVIDCDALSRNVVMKGSPCLSLIARRFGEEYITSDGVLDRKKMAELVFSDSEKRRLLNDTMYPFITYDVLINIRKCGRDFVVIDAPTLFESGIDAICDEIVSVVCDKEVSVVRIMNRDKIDRQLAENRLSSQHCKEYYLSKSTMCLENNGSIGELTDKAYTVMKEIKLKYVH